MNRWLCIAVLVVVVCGLVAAQNVVVVVMDGARYDETFGADSINIPEMWNTLRPEGTIWTDFRNEGLTLTNPGHAGIVTGTWQEIDNGGLLRPTLPTIFEYFREHTGAPDSAVVVITGKVKLNILAHSDHPKYGGVYGALFAMDSGDAAVFARARSILRERHPRIVVVNFAGADAAGHASDWPGYLNAIRAQDSYVSQIWQMIQSDPLYRGATTLFVTNDHGRHSTDYTSHGDGCEGCRHIMLLACGRGFPKGIVVLRRRAQIDIAPTIGALLGFPTSFATGRSLLADTVVTGKSLQR